MFMCILSLRNILKLKIISIPISDPFQSNIQKPKILNLSFSCMYKFYKDGFVFSLF